jgi:hypothetical protein
VTETVQQGLPSAVVFGLFRVPMFRPRVLIRLPEIPLPCTDKWPRSIRWAPSPLPPDVEPPPTEMSDDGQAGGLIQS